MLYKLQRPGIAPHVRSMCPSFVDLGSDTTIIPVGVPTRLASLLRCCFDIALTWVAVFRHEKDLMLFHNRGVTHSVVGAFKDGQVRKFHQCNLAASDFPAGPTQEDVKAWA